MVFGDVPQGREYFSPKVELFLLLGKIFREHKLQNWRSWVF